MRRLACLLLVAAALCGPPAARASDTVSVRREADWILSVQTADGAITMNAPYTDVNPYFANIAATGLAHASSYTGEQAYAGGAWRWLQWYATHMNADGTIDDYTRGAAGWVPAGSVDPTHAPYDSSDAYAATFVSAAAAAWRADPSPAAIAPLRDALARAFDVMLSTRRADGLTAARPGSTVYYLMDNVEVYQASVDAQMLFGELGDDARAQAGSVEAAAVASALSAMWNPSTSMYDWAAFAGGARQPSSSREFYPSTVAQAWIVSAGLVPHDRAVALLNAVEDAQPDWDEPWRLAWNAGATAPQPIDWFPRIALAFAGEGMTSRAGRALYSFEQLAGDTQRLRPFHAAVAGTLVDLAAAVSSTVHLDVSMMWAPRSVLPATPPAAQSPCIWRQPPPQGCPGR